jgi:Na+-transporting NADH:ubiquinone oxidoreductase subunit C
MAFSNGYIIAFATGVCLVCSLAVAGTSQVLKERQDVNKKRDFQKNVLMALELGTADDLQGEKVDNLYAERVSVVVVDGEGGLVEGKSISDVDAARKQVKGSDKPPELFAVYQRIDEGKASKYAIPVFGIGLWGPISGFIAVGSDGNTVTGSTFAAPKETPGLGYEITAPAFTDQWTGKQFFDDGELKSISVVRGEVGLACPGTEVHCVQGVSGSTITSRGVDEMVAEAAKFYEPYLRKIQSGGT